MALSPIFVAMSPNVFGACIWQVVMTLGEVMWSPRQLSWTASLAPTGLEGLFFAVSSARSIMGPLTDVLMGKINSEYNPNCPDCRDQYGHFCDHISSEDDGSLQCISSQESCDIFLDNNQQSCPTTCLDCPSWQPTNPSTCWWLLMLASIATPLSIWAFLPFLRGNHNRDDHCYGLLSCSRTRFFGICGAQEAQIHHRVDGSQVYGHVQNESFHSGAGEGGIKPLGEDVELT